MNTFSSTYTSFEEYPAYPNESLWLDCNAKRTIFKIYSPTALEAKVNLYEAGCGDNLIESVKLNSNEEGLWYVEIQRDLTGCYYAYQVRVSGAWLGETPGIYATAVGVNGERAMVLDLSTTNPEGWESDERVSTKSPNEAIIYELHVHDLTSHTNSGSNKSGQFLGLVEEGTISPDGLKTGIDHLKELGITHVHLLPVFDHCSIDESKPDLAQFNWGYDPQNYNVPEGSYVSDPYHAEVRIREFKQMVKSFHDNGIGVILDVVYNHTGLTEESNFNRELPGYYYRQHTDGTWADASGCGNETASERPMMRKFMVESIAFWAREYHVDGFRFDLMGIHDIETMNAIADALISIDPNILIYGEGWTSGSSPLAADKRALKANTWRIPKISTFSDDFRDGIKGSVFDPANTGFGNGAEGMEESIKFGVVGSVFHDQINYAEVNYSDKAWANEPWQAVSYVSCHDNHTLFDKLSLSRSDASLEDIKAMHRLTNAIVLTSQGIPFLHAGVEMMRTKNGHHNSYNAPDSINQIDWDWKSRYKDVFDYHKGLIELRKIHPAFSMPTAEMVRENLSFKSQQNGVVSFIISGNANGDSWKDIMVIYNAKEAEYHQTVERLWRVAILGELIDLKGLRQVNDSLSIPPISMAVLFR